MMYPIVLEPDDNGTLLVTCPDLPEVSTWGEDEDDALRHAADAIEEALASIIARGERIPEPSRQPTAAGLKRRKLKSPVAVKPNQTVRIPTLSPLTEAKIALFRAAYDARVSKAELGRRLGWHSPQIARLFDLNHHSRIEQIDQALRVLGKRISLTVRDAA